MRQKIFLPVLFTSVLAVQVKAQALDSLQQLQDHSFPVYYSAGHQQRTQNIASLIEKAIAYHQSLLDFKPSISLLVLSARDWNTYIVDPLVYGMAHYNEKTRRLIVAAEDNPFWRSFLPPLDALPNDLREPVKAAYATGNGDLSMQPFFDLLAIHELGHAFHFQAGITMQRKWMGELFSNILLHTFIAEKEPELLPALVVFPRMVVAGGAKDFKYTSLRDLEERYYEIGQHYPQNYGWYQCRWHVAAADSYDAGGKQVCQKLWSALKGKQETLDDEELGNFLLKVDKTVANMMLSW